MIVVIARSKLQNEQDRDLMMHALLAATPATLQEPGMIAYQSGIDCADPLVINAVEVYESETAVIAHVKSEHIGTLMASLSNIRADISLKAYNGAMEPFDIGAVLAGEAMSSESALSFSNQ